MLSNLKFVLWVAVVDKFIACKQAPFSPVRAFITSPDGPLRANFEQMGIYSLYELYYPSVSVSKDASLGLAYGDNN